MIWPTTSILEEEFNDDEYELSKSFIASGEDLHGGTTFIFESAKEKSEVDTDEDIRYFQFKTVIEENDQNYFIYDEVIQINGKLVLLLRLHNDETKEICEQMIYFEKNKVVEQVRHFIYDQFFSEINNNEKIFRTE